MDQQARAAFIQSQVACMLAEIAGMQAENQSCGTAIAPYYKYDDFMALIAKYQLGHNTIISYLMEQR